MKKLTAILLIFTLIFALVSCFEGIYDQLNKFAAKQYSMIQLEVFTTADGKTLKSSYSISENLIRYSVESINGMSLDSQDEFIKTQKGEALISNGNITKLNGDNVTLPEYATLTGKFTFLDKNFDNVKFEDGSFSADVLNPASFISLQGASAANIKNATVSIKFNAKGFESMRITYTEGGVLVVMSYTFV